MPELPDVEVFRRHLEAHGLNRSIAGVEPGEDGEDGEDILEEVTPRRLRDALRGHAFTATRRHGKYLFATIGNGTGRDAPGVVVFHFGMTGLFEAYEGDEPPDHTRLRLDFADGGHLAYRNQRKLGRVTLASSAEAFIAEKELGPDALDGVPDAAALRELLRGQRGGLKSALMKQELLAGIGNVYSDEICFQARLDPRMKVARLDTAAVAHLHETMHRVLREAIAAGADPARMPARFLTPHREEGGSCPHCGAPVEKLKVSGRSAWWCPRCQGG